MAVQLAIAELPLKAGAVGNGKNAVAIQAAVAELPLQAIARLAVFDPLLEHPRPERNRSDIHRTMRDPLIWLGAGVHTRQPVCASAAQPGWSARAKQCDSARTLAALVNRDHIDSQRGRCRAN